MNKYEFRGLSRDNKKRWLLEFTKKFSIGEKRGPFYRDLAKYGVTHHDIEDLFQSLKNLFVQCDIEPHYRRKIGRTDEELKQYMQNIAVINQQTKCWTTDKIKSRQPGTNRKLIKYKHKTMLLHRLSYLLFNGPLMSGKCIRHKCDNDGCYNPEHLEQGTYAENNRDTITRGRHRSQTQRDSYKSSSPRHKLTDPYDKDKLLAWVKSRIRISEKEEWLYPNIEKTGGYALITINRRPYLLHRLMLANKLNIKYDDVDVACHKFPPGSVYSAEAPSRNDVNPEHLYNGTNAQNASDSLPYHKGVKISLKIKQKIYEEADDVDFSKRGAAEEFDLRMAQCYGVSPFTISQVRIDANYKGSHNKPIIQLTKEGVFVKKYASAREAANDGYSWKNISQVITGEKKTHQGFLWKLAE